MAGTIVNICLEIWVTSDCLDHGIRDRLDIGLNAAPNIVCFTDFPFLEDEINGVTVI